MPFIKMINEVVHKTSRTILIHVRRLKERRKQIMNKLFTKIAALALGATMAVGVGVAVASSGKEASPVHAADPTATFAATNTTAVQNQEGDITSQVGLSSSIFTATLTKNGAGNAMYIKKNDFRMYGTKQTYKGNYLTISVTSAYTIKSFVFGGTTALTTAQVFKGAVSVSSNQVTGTSVTASSGTYTINSTEFTIYNNNKNVSSNTQVKFGSITITYASASIPTTSVDVSPATVTLAPNETQQLTTTVLPANTTDTLSYSSNASDVATVSSSGLITAHADGTATITATSGNYSDTCVVTVETPTTPFITPEKTSTSGYTGCDETIGFTYGNLTGTLGVSTSNANVSAIIQNDDGENADVVITFNTATASDSYVYLKDGSTTLATITVTSITASSVTITGLPASATLYNNSTLNLGSQITVTATGSMSSDVTWESDDEDVATVSAAGVVTPVANGEVNITVTSDDYPSATMTCAVTVSDAPQKYTITGPSETQASGTGLTVQTLNTYYPIDSNAYIEWTAVSGSAYGSSTSAMRFGTSTASATGYVTLSLKSDAPIYFTKVVVNAKTWSTETGNTLKVNNDTATVTSSYSDYEFTIASDVTSINFGNGTKRVNIYAIDVYYAYKTPELHVSSASVEAAINTSNTHVNLTYDNYTPTSYTAVVKSGSSLTASAVSFDTSSTPHTATFTTGSSTGTTVFTITGTGGGKSASADVSVTVTNPRNITDLSITTAGTLTFKVGETFDVGSLVVTATFDAEPTTVVYSKANENIAELTFSTEIGYEFLESDIGSQTVTISKAVGTGDESASYTITVSDKDYAAAVTSITNLWDGQKVYFSNGSNEAFPMYTSGNNVSSVSVTINESKGLDIASTTAYQYTVGREEIDDTVYYTFEVVDNDTIYYIKDAGTSQTNAIARTTDKTDTSIYWTISAGSNSGQWHIVNRSNTSKPTLQVNGTYLSCYNNNQTDPYLYAVTPYSEQTVADAFVDNYLHMDEDVPGQCNTYYPILKPVWAAMTDDEKIMVSGAAYARLQAWAAAHGEHLDSDLNLVADSRINPITIIGNKSDVNVIAIVVITSVVSLTAIGGYFFLRKRKENI